MQAVLRVWVGHQRFIYNAKVREQDYWQTFGRKALALTGEVPFADQAYSHFIGVDSQFLREVPSQILRNGAYRFAIACARMYKGLGSAPSIKKKHGRQSVMLTRELFEFRELTDAQTGEISRELWLLSGKKVVGRVPFKAHRAYELPASICVSVEPDGRWFVSFCAEQPAVALAEGQEPFILRTQKELAYEFGLKSGEELEALTVGIDRGVTLPVATSEGHEFVIPTVNAKRIAKKEKRAKRYQQRMARQVLGSKSRNETKRRIARLKGYVNDVRRDFSHKTSHALATSSAQIFVLEDLKLKNMTAAPAPRQDAAGRYTANGAAAKAGLNKAILASSLGQIKEFLSYKAAQRNKLVLKVTPYNSSNECAECGHVDSASRISQAEFVCTKCRHADNADHNAARVIKKRGIKQLVEQTVVFKQKKTARVRGTGGKKTKAQTLVVKAEAIRIGPVRPESGECARPTPGESVSDEVSGYAANDAVLEEPGNRHPRRAASGGR